MTDITFLLAAIFVIINVVQTWLIFACKLLVKGGLVIGAMELVEAPLIIYLIMKGGMVGFATVVLVEVVQWLLIAYFSTKSKIN